jgi:hypothetical protein
VKWILWYFLWSKRSKQYQVNKSLVKFDFFSFGGRQGKEIITLNRQTLGRHKTAFQPMFPVQTCALGLIWGGTGSRRRGLNNYLMVSVTGDLTWHSSVHTISSQLSVFYSSTNQRGNKPYHRSSTVPHNLCHQIGLHRFQPSTSPTSVPGIKNGWIIWGSGATTDPTPVSIFSSKSSETPEGGDSDKHLHHPALGCSW